MEDIIKTKLKELKFDKKQLNKISEDLSLIVVPGCLSPKEIEIINEEKVNTILNKLINIALIKELNSCLKEYDKMKIQLKSNLKIMQSKRK